MKRRVLLLCTASSCPSRMAEGIANYFGGEAMDIFSAGSKAPFVNPTAVDGVEKVVK